MAVGSTKVVQVTNIAPQATKDQMHVLFGYLGKIEDIRLYPTVRDVSIPVQSRICYIKFVDPVTVGIAQHMTNTVFIDRALVVIPVQNGEIPDEYYALEMTRNGTIVPGLNVSEPKLPPHVVNSVQGSGSDQVILTTDSTLEQNDLPNYPPLPANYDSIKVEETRRTIIIENVDTSVTNEDWIEFFSSAGEVKYLRTCIRTLDNTSHLLIEFTEQASIISALKMDGIEFRGNILTIRHSTTPITKPQAKSNEAAQKEIEEAMTRFKEAQNMINASIEPVIGMLTKDKKSSRRSRSRSKSRDRRRRRTRSRSRHRSRSRRRRSSSRRRSKSRERRRRSKSKSKSRSRRRSTSKPRRRTRSRSRKSRSRSRRRSRSRDKKSRARSKDRKSREKSKDRKKSKERERSKDRKSRANSKTKEKSTDSKDRKSESIDIERKRSKSKSRSRSRKRSRSRDRRRERRRSRSRTSRRRSPSPRAARRRSRSRTRDRDRDKKRDRKDRRRTRSRSKSRDRKASSRAKSRVKSRSKSRSRSKVPRSRDASLKPVAEKDKPQENIEEAEKDSGEKSDNMDISNSP